MLEPSHRGGSNEYSQSMFWTKIRKTMYLFSFIYPIFIGECTIIMRVLFTAVATDPGTCKSNDTGSQLATVNRIRIIATIVSLSCGPLQNQITKLLYNIYTKTDCIPL